MARGLVEAITDALSGLQLFPFFCMDFTDGTNDYKYTTLDVPITLKDVDFDNDPNMIVDDYDLDAKELSDWTLGNATRTQDSTTAPDGTVTGTKLTEDAIAAATHAIYIGEHDISDDTSYTWSFFLKAGDKNRAVMRIDEGGPAWNDYITINFDLSAETSGTNTANGDVIVENTSITSYPNDWYLCTLTGKFGSVSDGDHRMICFLTETNSSWTTTYDGDGSSYIYVWGAKLTQSSSYQYSSGDGNYDPRGFEFESINYTLSNVMDDCTLRIDNLDSVLTSIFVDGTIEGETASVYLGLLDTDDSVLGTVLIFTGEVDSFDLDESEVRLVIGSIFTRWAQESYNSHPSSCRWKVFKGDECVYSGAVATCDRRYVTCQALGNTANFGGFRWLPSIENKKIQWGPTSTEAAYIAKQ